MITFDPLLLKDAVVLGKFKLCHVLLMRDAHYPWCLLVPDRENSVEVFDLDEKDQKQLTTESNQLSKFLKKYFKADKMNVAALGNVVSQLHIHHIVRYKTDIAWPAPIWGAFPAKKYSDKALENLINELSVGFKTLNLQFEIYIP